MQRLTRARAQLLRRGRRRGAGHDAVVMATRHGSPMLPEVLDKPKLERCGHIAILPTHPQYPDTTTIASTYDAVLSHHRRACARAARFVNGMRRAALRSWQ